MSVVSVRSSLLVVSCWLLGISAAGAATLPAGFSETRVASGLASPTAMAIAPDGRVFVAEKAGALRVVKDDALLPQPFLNVNVNTAGERGLLGVAFDPLFHVNRHVYVYYTTASSPIHNRVSRFTASASNPDVAQAGSELPLLDLPTLGSAVHNGGAIHFGYDGMLYVAVGENSVPANSQSLNTPLGKLLRIHPNGTIPTDNPFYQSTSGVNRAIFALGLRNPYNFAVDPYFGRMHINDVGQDAWEEVNPGSRAANYGWPQTEGPSPAGVSGVRYPLHSHTRLLVKDYGKYVVRFGEIARYLERWQPQALMLWARHDPFFDLGEVLSWMRALPRMEAHVLDAGHKLVETHSAAAGQLMREFIRRAPGS